jgi:hypothetical protein
MACLYALRRLLHPQVETILRPLVCLALTGPRCIDSCDGFAKDQPTAIVVEPQKFDRHQQCTIAVRCSNGRIVVNSRPVRARNAMTHWRVKPEVPVATFLPPAQTLC